MLAADFKSDITADFNYFNGLSKITPSSPNDPPKVNEIGLTEGMKADLWLNKNKITPADYLTIYPRMQPSQFMNMKEFAYFEIDYFSKKMGSDMKCSHCL